MYNKILIRFGELSTKGKNKMTFVRKLAKNIEQLMGVKTDVVFDRIYLPYAESSLEGLKNIFGISSYSPVFSTNTQMEDIEKVVLAIIKDADAETFKISARRNWKGFELSSNDINLQLGGLVLRNSEMKVKLKNPDLDIRVEVREKETFIFFKVYKGLGGFPVGTNGKVLHLISGGIDSPFAAIQLMKKGLNVDFLSFVTPPHTDEKTVEKVNRIISILNKFQGKATLYRSNYTKIMNLLGLTSNQAYKITLMRRSFYRIATKIAAKNNYIAISNGESLGQVASQTLESINTIQEQTSLPVLRPLLTWDKQEIIDSAKIMGTYNISIEQGIESCELFAPDKPTTKPKISIAYNLEKELSGLLNLEEENIKEIEVIRSKKSVS